MRFLQLVVPIRRLPRSRLLQVRNSSLRCFLVVDLITTNRLVVEADTVSRD